METKQSKLKEAWDDPIGKVLILIIGSAALISVIGGTFKALAFATNSFKDFRDAVKR